MKPSDIKQSKCGCGDCGNCPKSKPRSATEPISNEPPANGFFARRPWIWFVIAHVGVVAILTVMVVIAVKFQQPDVLIHGR